MLSRSGETCTWRESRRPDEKRPSSHEGATIQKVFKMSSSGGDSLWVHYMYGSMIRERRSTEPGTIPENLISSNMVVNPQFRTSTHATSYRKRRPENDDGSGLQRD